MSKAGNIGIIQKDLRFKVGNNYRSCIYGQLMSDLPRGQLIVYHHQISAIRQFGHCFFIVGKTPTFRTVLLSFYQERTGIHIDNIFILGKKY